MDIIALIAGFPVILFLIFLGIVFIRQIQEYERGVYFTFGRYSKIKEPGWRIVVPIFTELVKVDIRTKAVDVPDQDCISKDNITIKINAVIYYHVSDASKAVIAVENYFYAISQLAQTTMRNIAGEVTLDELLQNREAMSQKIQAIVDSASDRWGIDVESVELKDIILPESMERMMAREAEAEREKRAIIIKAEGDVIAAENLSLAAKKLAEEPGAMHLRTLQTINELASDQSNTTIWMIPTEILRAIEGFVKK